MPAAQCERPAAACQRLAAGMETAAIQDRTLPGLLAADLRLDVGVPIVDKTVYAR
jgi:hypothetical protein